MTDVTQHNTEAERQAPTTTTNTLSADVVTGVVQAAMITSGIHHHQPTPRPPTPTPHQLPRASAGFTGRVDQLAALDHALTTLGCSPEDGGQGRGATAVISTIGGTGGIGKSWLALYQAHRNLDRFPDGQLSVDLRGFSPGDPKQPADALAEFLAALGVDHDHQPTDLDAQIGLYRTRTAGKRMLILLDNAANPHQVVPLLPGGDSCTVLITSRRRRQSLIARHSARPVHLDVFTDAEAAPYSLTPSTTPTPRRTAVPTPLPTRSGRSPS